VASLQTILAVQETEFTASEEEQAYFPKVPYDVDTDGAVACVQCGGETTKRTVLGTILLDICAGHGVWLDTGELKAVQILTGANVAVRTALQKVVSG
jgi:hypothetical protein